MDKEPDLSNESPDEIRHRIEETRSDLTEKLETLEHEVKDTVRGATNAVVDTVQTVRNTVEGTVEAVKQKVEGTVNSVTQTLDLRRLVERHPWSMVGGSIALGYLAGSMLPRPLRLTRTAIGGEYLSSTGYPEPEIASPGVERCREEDRFLGEGRDEAPIERRESSSWTTNLAQQFAPEIAQVKHLAIAAVLGLLAEQVKKSLPDNLSAQVGTILDSVTSKLAGDPVPGPAFAGSERRRSTQPNGVR
jgi:ElaB/YqjD/DUF883 family membrane-anchored ribosome-binding protein